VDYFEALKSIVYWRTWRHTCPCRNNY